jgi:heme oxygenase
MVIAARCLTGATEEMKRLWKNFLASVDQVRDSDQEEEDASESREVSLLLESQLSLTFGAEIQSL